MAEDPAAYSSWVINRERSRAARSGRPTSPPLRLITVVAGEVPPAADETLRALARQTTKRWRLDISTTTPWRDEIEELVRSSLASRFRRRVRVVAQAPGMSIRQQLTALLTGSTPENVALIHLGDVWAPDAVATLAQVAPGSVMYADDDMLLPSGEHVRPVLKPDFSPDFLLTTGYVRRPLAIGHAVAARLPRLVAESVPELEHDLALAACDVADTVVHVPEVLCHRTDVMERSAGGETGHVEEALRRRAEVGAVTSRSEGAYRVVRSAPHDALVSIVIPFRDQPRFLRTCVDSVSATTREGRVEFILIDNGSTDPEMLTLLEELGTRPDVTLLTDPSPFNWARLNNAGAAAAGGEVLLFSTTISRRSMQAGCRN